MMEERKWVARAPLTRIKMTTKSAFNPALMKQSVAIVEDGHIVLSNAVATQINSHQRFGGICPRLPVATILNGSRGY